VLRGLAELPVTLGPDLTGSTAAALRAEPASPV